MLGAIFMFIGASVALAREVHACKIIHPGISDQLAFELSVRPQGCVPKPPVVWRRM